MVLRTSSTVSSKSNHDENHSEQQLSKKSQSILRNKVILSILVTETAERVAYFGFRAVLVLYFTNGLNFSESTSVALFASVSGLAYLSPLVGALLADSLWGRYTTILRFGTLYSIGMCLITMGAYQLGPPLPIDCPISMNTNAEDCGDINNGENLLMARSFSFVGLIFVCLGTGGIKPCVSAFGADQVVLSDSHIKRLVPETSSSKTVYCDVGHEDLSDLDIDDNSSTIAGATASTLEPCDTSLHAREEHLREFFNSFYFCINVGALFSFALIPMVRAKFGFGAAFLIPSMFMIGALSIFLSQRKAYKNRERDSSQPSLSDTLYLCWKILFAKTSGNYSQVNIPAAESKDDREVSISTDNDDTPEVEDEYPGILRGDDDHQVRKDAEQVLHLMPLMVFFPVFWMLYDQQGSVWTLQATHLNLHGLQPEQTGLLNPLEIMLFIPLFDKIIYPRLEAKGFNIQPLKRMECGMFLGAVAFIASALLEYSIERAPPNSVSLAWQIPQITILTVAEILLNVTGLEFAYSQAPDSLQALILAVFLFMTAIGDGFGSLLFATVFRDLNTAVTMVTCAVSMLVNLAFFSRVARHWTPYKPRTDSEEEEGLELNVLASCGEIS